MIALLIVISTLVLLAIIYLIYLQKNSPDDEVIPIDSKFSLEKYNMMMETVLQGMKALKIEESVKEIIKRIGVLGKHLNSFEEFFGKIGRNIGLTVSSYNSASGEFKKIDKDVVKITEGDEGGTYETMQLDKPHAE